MNGKVFGRSADDAIADGTCNIEVLPTEDGQSDRWTPHGLKLAVIHLLNKCVNGNVNEGGEGTGMGQSPSGNQCQRVLGLLSSAPSLTSQ